MMVPRSQEQEVAEVALEPRLVRFPVLSIYSAASSKSGRLVFFIRNIFFSLHVLKMINGIKSEMKNLFVLF